MLGPLIARPDRKDRIDRLGFVIRHADLELMDVTPDVLLAARNVGEVVNQAFDSGDN